MNFHDSQLRELLGPAAFGVYQRCDDYDRQELVEWAERLPGLSDAQFADLASKVDFDLKVAAGGGSVMDVEGAPLCMQFAVVDEGRRRRLPGYDRAEVSW